MDALRLRGGRHDPLRDARFAGIHSRQTGGPFDRRLERPSGGRPASLLPLYDRGRRRGDHRQTAQLCNHRVAPDPALHRNRNARRGRQAAGTDTELPVERRRRPFAAGKPENQGAGPANGAAPRPETGQREDTALYGRRYRTDRKLRRRTLFRKNHGRHVHARGSVQPGENQLLGRTAGHRPDRLRAGRARQTERQNHPETDRQYSFFQPPVPHPGAGGREKSLSPCRTLPGCRSGTLRYLRLPARTGTAYPRTVQTERPYGDAQSHADGQRLDRKTPRPESHAGGHEENGSEAGRKGQTDDGRHESGPNRYGNRRRQGIRRCGDEHRRCGGQCAQLQDGAGAKPLRRTGIVRRCARRRLCGPDPGRRLHRQPQHPTHGAQPLFDQRRSHPLARGMGERRRDGRTDAGRLPEKPRRQLSAESELHALVGRVHRKRRGHHRPDTVDAGCRTDPRPVRPRDGYPAGSRLGNEPSADRRGGTDLRTAA